MKKKIGIYAIINKINGKRYIGQSVDVNSRFVRHRYQLNKGIHANAYLQRAWDKYGVDNFEFKIIVECNEENLDLMEETYCHQTSSDMLYNIADDFTSRVGSKNPFYGKNHKKTSKCAMSQWKKKHYLGSDNPNFRNRWSEEQRDTMRGSKNHHAKLSEKEVIEIKRFLSQGMKHSDIAIKFGISRTVVTRINSGARWGHIKMEV